MSIEMYEYTISITLTEGDFIESIGRSPMDPNEFKTWAELAEKGLLNGHIDWGIIYECARDAMTDRDEDEPEGG